MSTTLSWLECLVLMAVGEIPVLTIEAIKAVRFYCAVVSGYVRLQRDEVKASALREVRHATRFNVFVAERLDLRGRPWTL